MFDFRTYLTKACPDLISRIKNIRSLGLHFSKGYNEVNVEDFQSNFARALVANQNIESLQLMCSYDKCKLLADDLTSAERPILTDLHFVTDMGVFFSSGSTC